MLTGERHLLCDDEINNFHDDLMMELVVLSGAGTLIGPNNVKLASVSASVVGKEARF